MIIEITEADYNYSVMLDGYYWLGRSKTYIFWWSDVVDPLNGSSMFITQHQKNSPCLNLSLERKFWILCFQVTRN